MRPAVLPPNQQVFSARARTRAEAATRARARTQASGSNFALPEPQKLRANPKLQKFQFLDLFKPRAVPPSVVKKNVPFYKPRSVPPSVCRKGGKCSFLRFGLVLHFSGARAPNHVCPSPRVFGPWSVSGSIPFVIVVVHCSFIVRVSEFVCACVLCFSSFLCSISLFLLPFFLPSSLPFSLPFPSN